MRKRHRRMKRRWQWLLEFIDWLLWLLNDREEAT
jgi:hypothetical protein